jgi:hypothetical protein
VRLSVELAVLEARGSNLRPGSEEARRAGCTCPVMDNGHGRGYLGLEGVYVYSLSCPIHGGGKGKEERK